MYHVVEKATGNSVLTFTPRHQTFDSITRAFNAAWIVAETTNMHFGYEACYVDYRP